MARRLLNDVAGMSAGGWTMMWLAIGIVIGVIGTLLVAWKMRRRQPSKKFSPSMATQHKYLTADQAYSPYRNNYHGHDDHHSGRGHPNAVDKYLPMTNMQNMRMAQQQPSHVEYIAHKTNQHERIPVVRYGGPPPGHPPHEKRATEEPKNSSGPLAAVYRPEFDTASQATSQWDSRFSEPVHSQQLTHVVDQRYPVAAVPHEEHIPQVVSTPTSEVLQPLATQVANGVKKSGKKNGQTQEARAQDAEVVDVVREVKHERHTSTASVGRSPEYEVEDLDEEWLDLLKEVNTFLASRKKESIRSARERAVAVNSLLVSTVTKDRTSCVQQAVVDVVLHRHMLAEN